MGAAACGVPGARIQRCSVRHSRSGSIGLPMWSLIPASRQRSRSCGITLALMAMMGSCENWRIPRVAARPSMTGICTSISTASNAEARTMRTATAPLSASSTCKPALSSSSRATSWFRSLSSTTRMRAPAKERSASAGPGAGCGVFVGGLASAMPTRAVNQNVLPCPGSARTPTSPCISVARFLEIARPSPVPPYWRVVEASACWKGWNSCRHCSGVRPMPVSLTSPYSSTSWSVCSRTCREMAMRPWGVNLTALLA